MVGILNVIMTGTQNCTGLFKSDFSASTTASQTPTLKSATGGFLIFGEPCLLFGSRIWASVAGTLETNQSESPCHMLAFEDFLKVIMTVARDSRLGIFRMECAHRSNKALSESCQHLSTAKTWCKLSAESFLGQSQKFRSSLIKIKQG